MANRNILQSAISTILIIALFMSTGAVLSGAGRTPPENPIDQSPEQLYPESMSGGGSLKGTDGDNKGEDGNGEQNTPEPSEPPEETPEPENTPEPTPTPETTPPPTPKTTASPSPAPERTPEPTPEPDAGGDEEQPDESPDPSQPPEEGGDTGGGTDPGEDDGGGSDSGDEGGGDSGGDGDGGAEGGEGGEGGGEEDKTPRIYTDLYNNMYLTKSDLPDGNLQFQAYPLGEGNLSIRVVLQNDNTPANGTVLSSSDGRNYVAALVFNGASYITIYLKQDGENIAYVRYKISYYADKADEEHPEIGDCPPTIITSLDGESLDIHTEHIVFWVRATMHPDLGGGTIYSNQIQVWLDGELLEKESGDTRPEYDVHFPVPNVGDYATHVIRVLAWDGNGNSTYKYYSINYHRIPDGLPSGKVMVILDATTVGLGIWDAAEINILGGETVASVVVRFLEGCGYQVIYDGTTDNAFYLRKISRADIGKIAKIPDLLQEMLERDGITFTGRPKRDELGEFDFTRGAGWMYSINGTVYPGRGMSEYPAQDGSTIYIRFTLAYGKDIAGFDASGGGYGSLTSYCRLWINGTVQELEHDFRETDRVEPTETEAGYVEYTCLKCHDVKQETLPATGDETEPTPTPEPTEAPTPEPTEAPTPEPTEAPTPEPTEAPTPEPTEAPTPKPTEISTPEPTEETTPEPDSEPSSKPRNRRLRIRNKYRRSV